MAIISHLTLKKHVKSTFCTLLQLETNTEGQALLSSMLQLVQYTFVWKAVTTSIKNTAYFPTMLMINHNIT